MAERYYLRIRGAVVGPFRADQVRQMLERGKIAPWQDVSTDRETWRPLHRYGELAPNAWVPSNSSPPATTSSCSISNSSSAREPSGSYTNQPPVPRTPNAADYTPEAVVDAEAFVENVPRTPNAADYTPEDTAQQRSVPGQPADSKDDTLVWLAVVVVVVILIVLLANSDCQQNSPSQRHYVPIPVFRGRPTPYKPRTPTPYKPRTPIRPRGSTLDIFTWAWLSTPDPKLAGLMLA